MHCSRTEPRVLAIALAALVVVALPSPGRSQPVERRPDAAKPHLDAAKMHFDLQEYEAAERELKQAYRFDPRPDILYAIAQAQRLDGDCASAIRSYQAFVRTGPPADQAELARGHIARCRETLAGRQRRAPPPRPGSVRAASPAGVRPAAALPRRRDPAPEPRGWIRNWVGHGLVLGGAAALAGGIVLARAGNAEIRGIDAAPSYEEYLERAASEDAAARKRTIGLATAGTGGALVVSGLLCYWLMGEDGTDVAISPIAGGGALTLAGRF
jgi:hypothetical protein